MGKLTNEGRGEVREIMEKVVWNGDRLQGSEVVDITTLSTLVWLIGNQELKLFGARCNALESKTKPKAAPRGTFG